MSRCCFVVVILTILVSQAMSQNAKITESSVWIEGNRAVPGQINFQGYLTDSLGTPLNGTYALTFRIYDSSVGGTSLFGESQMVAVDQGVFNAQIGAAIPIPSSVFTGADRWLQVYVGGEALSPRSKITSVAHGYRSIYADSAGYAQIASVSCPLDLICSASHPEGVISAENTGSGHGLVVADAGADGVKVEHADSFGLWVGDAWCGIWIDSTSVYPGLYVRKAQSTGVLVENATSKGVSITNAGNRGVYVGNAGDDAYYIYNTDGNGLDVHYADENGVLIEEANDAGVRIDDAHDGLHVENAEHSGVKVANSQMFGVVVDTSESDGFYVIDAGDDGLDVFFAGSDGVQVISAGDHGVYVNHADIDGFHVYDAGNNGVKVENAYSAGVFAEGKRYGGCFMNDTTGADYPALRAHNRYSFTGNERIADMYAANFLQFYFQGNGYAYANGGWNTFKRTEDGRYESFSSTESERPELLCHGTAVLNNGVARVDFSPSFAAFVTDREPIEIHLTPVGSYSGLYVEERSTEGFTVRSGAGDLNCEFFWTAMGVIKNKETRVELDAVNLR